MIRKAQLQDVEKLTELALQLWPDHSTEELKQELSQMLTCEDAAFFLACEDGIAVGFAQCQLRRDYVEGTESSPVGYLEGIYVAEHCRGRGIAKSLLNQCEAWAIKCGCTEFASDCEIDNEMSYQFHLHMGFMEANRIICFAKKL